MNQEKIGKFIAENRKKMSLTQEQLAEKVGVSKNAVSKWERGICLMDMSLLKPLSEILNVGIVDILNGEIINDYVKEKYEQGIENLIKMNEKNSRSFAMYGLVISYIILFVFKEIKGLNDYDIISILLMYIGFKLMYKYKNKNIIYMFIGGVSIISSVILMIMYIKAFI